MVGDGDVVRKDEAVCLWIRLVGQIVGGNLDRYVLAQFKILHG